MNVVKKILHLPPLINFGLGIGLIVGAYIFEILGIMIPVHFVFFNDGLLH